MKHRRSNSTRLAASAMTLFACVTACFTAQAETAAPIDENLKVEGASFAASARAGRAWVDASLAKRFASGKEARRENTMASVRVPELVYENGAVVLMKGEARITCATVSGDAVTPTGACTIRVHTESRETGGVRPSSRNHLVVVVVDAARNPS